VFQTEIFEKTGYLLLTLNVVTDLPLDVLRLQMPSTVTLFSLG